MITTKRQKVTDQVTGNPTTYCYDPMGRLTQAATTAGPTYAYGYSASSNRKSDAAGTHTFNTANQLTDTGHTYDADGNLTASPARPALAYNGVGQTTSITPSGGSAVPFAYSGASQGERTTAGSTASRNGPLGIDAEVTGGATTTYIRDAGGGLVSGRTPGGDFYYYFDGLGSVIGLVDPAGVQRASYTYDPYGANATATAVNGALPANPWRFAGGYLDVASGLYHFGARYYDPAMGRWTQPESGSDYQYAENDPVNLVDRTGRSATVHCGTITCSIYLSREATKYIADRSNEGTFALGLAGAAACAPLGPVASFACGAAFTAVGFVVGEAASRAAEKGGCLKITYLKYPPYSITYVSSNTGQYCFSDYPEFDVSKGPPR